MEEDNLNEIKMFSQIYNQNIKGKMDFIYINSILNNFFFEEELVREMVLYLKKDSDIIDIGANIGLVTLGIKRYLELNNCVSYINNFHCFECNPEIFPYLHYNTKSHDNIIIYNNGISHKIEMANMSTSSDNNGTTYVNRILNNKEIKILEYNDKIIESFTLKKNIVVPLLPLDLFIDVFKNTISVIKIDVEGYEANVLLGAKQIIEKHKPAIFIEIEEQLLNTIQEIMNSYNYTCVKIITKKYLPRDYVYIYNTFLYNNK